MSSLDLGMFGWHLKSSQVCMIVLSSQGDTVNPGLAGMCWAQVTWQHPYSTAGSVCPCPGALAAVWSPFSHHEAIAAAPAAVLQLTRVSLHDPLSCSSAVEEINFVCSGVAGGGAPRLCLRTGSAVIDSSLSLSCGLTGSSRVTDVHRLPHCRIQV